MTTVKAQVFNAVGVPAPTAEISVDIDSFDQRPSVAALSDGGFVVAWQDSSGDANGSGVLAQLYDAAGNPDGGQVPVNTTTTAAQLGPTAVGLADGGFVVIWYDHSELVPNGTELRGQIFDNAGAPVGTEFDVKPDAPGDQFLQSVTALGNGGFVVTWSNSQGDNDLYGVRAQIFNADGSKFGDDFLVNEVTANNQDNPSVAALGDDGFVVSWTTYSADQSDSDVQARVFSTDGPANHAPIIDSGDNFSVPENSTAVTTVLAHDPDAGQQPEFSIVAGGDGALFTINSATGALSFLSAPDFETPGSTNSSNTYQVTVRASDSSNPGLFDDQLVTVTVTDVSEGAVSSLFAPGDAPDTVITDIVDTTDYELGVRFTANQAGFITALQYFRGEVDANDTDIRTLNLWDASGALLGSVTVTSGLNEFGWQYGTLVTPIAIAANTVYVASYGTTQNYAFTASYFDEPHPGPGGVLNPVSERSRSSQHQRRF